MADDAVRVPAGASALIPRLFCRDPAAEMDGSSPVGLYVYLDDVDSAVQRALELGATLLSPPQDQFWGDRTAWVMDPQGHVWTFATRIEETTDAQRNDRFAAIRAAEAMSSLP